MARLLPPNGLFSAPLVPLENVNAAIGICDSELTASVADAAMDRVVRDCAASGHGEFEVDRSEGRGRRHVVVHAVRQPELDRPEGAPEDNGLSLIHI